MTLQCTTKTINLLCRTKDISILLACAGSERIQTTQTKKKNAFFVPSSGSDQQSLVVGDDVGLVVAVHEGDLPIQSGSLNTAQCQKRH